MPTFQIILNDRATLVVDDADAYQQEGQMTTFFRTGDDRRVIDAWSTRVASVRTGEIMVIQRNEDANAASAERSEGCFKVVV